MTLPDGDCAVKYVNGNMDVVIQSNFTFIYVIVAFVVIVSCAVIVLLAIKRKKAAALK